MKYDKKRGAAVIEEWPKRLPLGKLNWALFIISGVALVVSLVRLMMVYGSLPDIIPTHFNAAGEVDGTGGKGSMIFIAVLDVVVWASVTLLQFFPRVINVPVFLLKRPAEEIIQGTRVMLNVMAILMVALFWYLQEKTIVIALGAAVTLGSAFMWAFLAAIIAITAIYMFWLWRA